MNRVEIRNPTGDAEDARVFLDGHEVHGIVSYALTQASLIDDGRVVLTLELAPRSVVVELPDALVRIIDDAPRVSTDDATVHSVPVHEIGRSGYAERMATADVSTREKLLDAVAGELSRTVVGAIAEQWAALPRAAQLAILRTQRLATADEVLDAENDDAYAATLIASAYHRAATHHAQESFFAAVRSVAFGVESARRARRPYLVPGVDVVVDADGNATPFDKYQQPDAPETTPTTSEGDEA